MTAEVYLVTYYAALLTFTVGFVLGKQWPGLGESLIASPEVSKKTVDTDEDRCGKCGELYCAPYCHKCLPTRHELNWNISYLEQLARTGNLSDSGRRNLTRDLWALHEYNRY